MIQRQVEEEEEGILQTKELTGETPEVTPNIEARINTLRGSGQPLPVTVRNSFEPRFGYDFSNVRVHTDSNAVQMNKELNAEAFTFGRDIYFGVERYSLDTSTGKRLLAHELTHVVQQEGPSFAPSIRADFALPLIGPPNTMYEQEADRITKRVTRMSGPLVQRRPRFQDCDRQGGTSERDAVTRAHDRAIEMLRNTNRIFLEAFGGLVFTPRTMRPRFQMPSPGAMSRLAPVLRVAFEIRDVRTETDKVDRIRTVVSRSLAGLQRESGFNYECDYQDDWNPPGGCAPSVHAWTGPAWDIHICWDFFDARDPRNQALKIAHEATHKWGETVDGGGDPLMDAYGYNWLIDSLNR